jgi:hypothetical protein
MGICEDGNLDENENKTHTVNGGHTKSFCVGVLEAIKSGKSGGEARNEARCSGITATSIMSGLLGCSRTGLP